MVLVLIYLLRQEIHISSSHPIPMNLGFPRTIQIQLHPQRHLQLLKMLQQSVFLRLKTSKLMLGVDNAFFIIYQFALS
jgi:hypothetical protein